MKTKGTKHWKPCYFWVFWNNKLQPFLSNCGFHVCAVFCTCKGLTIVAIGFMCLRILVTLYKVRERLYAELIPVCLSVCDQIMAPKSQRTVYNTGPRVRVICQFNFFVMNCEELKNFCSLWSTSFPILLPATWKSGCLHDERSMLATVKAAIKSQIHGL